MPQQQAVMSYMCHIQNFVVTAMCNIWVSVKINFRRILIVAKNLQWNGSQQSPISQIFRIVTSQYKFNGNFVLLQFTSWQSDCNMHKSIAFVLSAKFCSTGHLSSRSEHRARTKLNYQWIWITIETLLLKWAPILKVLKHSLPRDYGQPDYHTVQGLMYQNYLLDFF